MDLIANKEVPYHGNPGNACALVCYTMAAQYLLPDDNITFEQLGKVGDWHKGYVIWAYPVWRWLMDKGVKITCYDSVDYDMWAKQGEAGLRRSISAKEFKFYKENTYDLDKVCKQLQLVWNHPNFNFIHKDLS